MQRSGWSGQRDYDGEVIVGGGEVRPEFIVLPTGSEIYNVYVKYFPFFFLKSFRYASKLLTGEIR